MGKINQGPFGGVNGQIGNLIGSSWKNQAYFRIRPQKYSDKKSEKQLNHRSRFSKCVFLAQQVIGSLIKTIWNKRAVDMSGYNLFIQKNMDAFDGTGSISDYNNLQLSVGNLPLPEVINAIVDGNTHGMVNLTWNDNSGNGLASPNDRLCVVFLLHDTPQIIEGINARRSDGNATVQLIGVTSGIVHLYVYFCDGANENFSNSYHLPVIISPAPNN